MIIQKYTISVNIYNSSIYVIYCVHLLYGIIVQRISLYKQGHSHVAHQYFRLFPSGLNL